MTEVYHTSTDPIPNETTSLLLRPRSNPKDIENLNQLECRDYVKEAGTICKDSIPIILSNIVQRMIAYSSVFFIGQYLGKYELAAASLSNMFATITGWSLAQSMANVLDTLCSQAFTGSSDIYLVGVYLQRGVLITSSMFVPIGVVWWHTEYFLNLLDLDPQLASMCGSYLKVLLLGSVPYIIFECLKKFMFAQGITKAPSYISIIVLPIHCIFNYYLIANPTTSLGFIGAPLATVISYWVMLILGVTYVVFFNGYQAWGGWSKKSLKGWKSYIKLGIPSVIMTCSEWWAFEILALGASYLGILPLASYSVVMSITDLFYNVCYGVSIIASNKAGNLIGDLMVNRTIFTIRSALIAAVFCATIDITIILKFDEFLVSIFTQDKEVIELSASLLPYAACYQIFDGLSTVSGGILRGQGRHYVGAMINAIGYYLVSIPLGFYLAFHFKMGLSGLYCGIIIALILTSTSLVYSIVNCDWDQIITNCKIRLNSESQSDIINSKS